mgnify:CR=1 FL=1
MKKILQRIGLLAMAGMLLWGWQGMEAKAEDDIFTFKYSCHIDGTKSHVDKDEDGKKYYLYLYPEDGYAFTQAPSVSLYDETDKVPGDSFTKEQGNDNICYTYFILADSIKPNHVYSINIGKNGMTIITKTRITPTAPVIGQTLPSKWDINTTGVLENSLEWMSDGQDVTGFVAEPNKTYSANITLSTETDYEFRDNVTIDPKCVTHDMNNDRSFTFVYEFKTGDAQPSNPGNTNSEITSDSWKNWIINTDKVEHCGISRGYGYLDELDDKKTHLHLGVYPEDGYTFVEEPKVTWNGNPLQLLTDHAFNSEWHDYLLDDNGSGTIVVEAKAVKKETNAPETSAPASNDDSSEEPYKIINGARSTWNGSTTEGLTIRGDGDFAKFAGVRVDGNWIPSVHYEAKSGSTIVTLKPSYLASLAEGEHTVDIMWIDDSASTTFTVAANTAAAQPELDSVPKTGEGVMGWMPEILLLAAAGLVTFGGLLCRRSKIHF